MIDNVNRQGRGRAGSILMEALLVFPIYMILIGGIFWIGDLVLARQRLVIADRYAAWNLGNRHDPKAIGDVLSDIQTYFFDPGQQPFETVDMQGGSIPDVARWWQEAFARVTLTVEPPEWTQAWMLFSHVVAGTPLLKPKPGVPGRGEFAGGAGSPYFSDGHSVLMRTPLSADAEYFRNWDCYHTDQLLADPEGRWWDGWNAVVEEPWPPSFDEVDDIRHDGEEYTRFGQYVTWST